MLSHEGIAAAISLLCFVVLTVQRGLEVTCAKSGHAPERHICAHTGQVHMIYARLVLSDSLACLGEKMSSSLIQLISEQKHP